MNTEQEVFCSISNATAGTRPTTVVNLRVDMLLGEEGRKLRPFLEEHLSHESGARVLLDLSAIVKAGDTAFYLGTAITVRTIVREINPNARLAVCVPENLIEPFRIAKLESLMFVTTNRDAALAAVEEWPDAPEPMKEAPPAPAPRIVRVRLATGEIVEGELLQ